MAPQPVGQPQLGHKILNQGQQMAGQGVLPGTRINIQQPQQTQIIRPNIPQTQPGQAPPQSTQFSMTANLMQQGTQNQTYIQSTSTPVQVQQPNSNIIITNMSSQQSTATVTQQQQQVILNRPIQSQPNIIAQPQQQQQQQAQYQQAQTPQTNPDEDEMYNRKIEELKANHLARLEKMLAASTGRNPSETAKIKAFIDVVMGVRKVSMEILLKCEVSLNAQKQQLQPQQQQQQQQQIIQPQQQQIPQTQVPVQQQQVLKTVQQGPQIVAQTQQPGMIQQNLAPKPAQVTVPSPYQPPVKILPPQGQQLGPSPHQLQHPQIPPQSQQQQQQQQVSPNIHPQIKSQATLEQQPKSIPQIQAVGTPLKTDIVQQSGATQQQPPAQLLQPPRQSLVHELTQSIEACNNANPVHKSNVRLLIENIKNSIDGPPLKLYKIDKDIFRGVMGDSTSLKRKPLVNLRENLVVQRNTSLDQHIPKKLAIELASLPGQKFKIEAKSKNETVVFPLGQSNNIKSSLTRLNGIVNLKQENEYNYSEGMNETESENMKSINTKEAPVSALENKFVLLKCTILSKELPLVPPIRIFIPYNYPETNPFVDCIHAEESEEDMLPDYGKLINILV